MPSSVIITSPHWIGPEETTSHTKIYRNSVSVSSHRHPMPHAGLKQTVIDTPLTIIIIVKLKLVVVPLTFCMELTMWSSTISWRLRNTREGREERLLLHLLHLARQVLHLTHVDDAGKVVWSHP